MIMWNWVKGFFANAIDIFFHAVAQTPDGQIAAELKDVAEAAVAEMDKQNYSGDTKAVMAEKKIRDEAKAIGIAVTTVGIRLAIEAAVALMRSKSA